MEICERESIRFTFTGRDDFNVVPVSRVKTQIDAEWPHLVCVGLVR